MKSSKPNECLRCRAREINDSPLRGYDGMVDRYEAEIKGLQAKLDIADRIACFLKNHIGFIDNKTFRQDASDLLDAYFPAINQDAES